MAVVLAGSGVVVTAGPAQADPCGTSSHLEGYTQYVSLRNCGTSTIFRKAHIDGQWGRCLGVPRESSGTLKKLVVGYSMRPWGTAAC